MSNAIKVSFGSPMPVIGTVDDDWLSTPKTKLTFTDSPLTVVCAMLREGKNLVEIHSAIHSTGLGEQDFRHLVTEEDREYAKRVEAYFKNSIILRKLNNKHVSNFMNETYDILTDFSQISVDSIRILVKLPSLYEESKLTNELIGKYKSAEFKNSKSSFDYEGNIEFAGKIRRVSRNENLYRFYFSTESKNLVLVSIKNTDMSLPLWNFLSESKKPVKLKSHMFKKTQPGVDFNFLDLGLDYEIFDS